MYVTLTKLTDSTTEMWNEPVVCQSRERRKKNHKWDLQHFQLQQRRSNWGFQVFCSSDINLSTSNSSKIKCSALLSTFIYIALYFMQQQILFQTSDVMCVSELIVCLQWILGDLIKKNLLKNHRHTFLKRISDQDIEVKGLRIPMVSLLYHIPHYLMLLLLY